MKKMAIISFLTILFVSFVNVVAVDGDKTFPVQTTGSGRIVKSPQGTPLEDLQDSSFNNNRRRFLQQYKKQDPLRASLDRKLKQFNQSVRDKKSQRMACKRSVSPKLISILDDKKRNKSAGRFALLAQISEDDKRATEERLKLLIECLGLK